MNKLNANGRLTLQFILWWDTIKDGKPIPAFGGSRGASPELKGAVMEFLNRRGIRYNMDLVQDIIRGLWQYLDYAINERAKKEVLYR